MVQSIYRGCSLSLSSESFLTIAANGKMKGNPSQKSKEMCGRTSSKSQKMVKDQNRPQTNTRQTDAKQTHDFEHARKRRPISTRDEPVAELHNVVCFGAAS